MQLDGSLAIEFFETLKTAVFTQEAYWALRYEALVIASDIVIVTSQVKYVKWKWWWNREADPALHIACSKDLPLVGKLLHVPYLQRLNDRH